MAIVFVVLISALVAARYKLRPKTFGEKGHYRAVALDTIKALPIHYAGREACEACHSDIFQTHLGGAHKTVACEVCHGPAAAHTESPTDVVLPKPNQREGCPLCHGYNPSRPTGFPQIDPQEHYADVPCISCHKPHQPELTQGASAECSGCHAEIARTKAVSKHAPLACTDCHNVPEQHKVTPTLVRADKPTTREFCGKCHSQDAKNLQILPASVRNVNGIRKIDIATHGGGWRYSCWQCHYPHMPEGMQQ